MKKLIAAAVTVSALGFATAAFAQQPMQLTDRQMDTVTAGAASGAIVNLSAFAIGGFTATAETEGFAKAFQIPVKGLPISVGVVFAYGASASGN